MENNITYVFEENSFTDLTLYQYGYEKCAPMLSCGPATHNHYLLHYIIEGKGTYSIREASYNLKAGEAFLISPGNITLYVSDKANPWTYVWVEFGGLKVEKYLSDAGLSSKNPIYIPKVQKDTLEMKELMMNLLSFHGNTLKLLGNMYLILETLIRTSLTSCPPKSNSLQEFYVHEAILYIDRHYKEDISVAQLADWCNINRSYFGKIFHDTILLTPQKYIIKYRMNIACGLLRDTNLPISAIANEVGYDNQLNFSRTFKNEFGVSPIKWRRNLEFCENKQDISNESH